MDRWCTGCNRTPVGSVLYYRSNLWLTGWHMIVPWCSRDSSRIHSLHEKLLNLELSKCMVFDVADSRSYRQFVIDRRTMWIHSVMIAMIWMTIGISSIQLDVCIFHWWIPNIQYVDRRPTSQLKSMPWMADLDSAFVDVVVIRCCCGGRRGRSIHFTKRS